MFYYDCNQNSGLTLVDSADLPALEMWSLPCILQLEEWLFPSLKILLQQCIAKYIKGAFIEYIIPNWISYHGGLILNLQVKLH